MERRGFFGRMAVSVVAAVAGLCGVKTAKAQPDDAFEIAYWNCMESHAERVQCLNDMLCDYGKKLDAAKRCVEACRIMQEHGLYPAAWGHGVAVLCVNYATNQRWTAFGMDDDEHDWTDPVTAIIEAEPLYLAWVKEHKAKSLAVANWLSEKSV